MIEERDIQAEKKWRYENLAQITVASLRKKNIDAQYVPTGQEALSKILALIPNSATVAWGDSLTLHQLGVISEIRKMKDTVIVDLFERNADGSLKAAGQERLALMRKAMIADVFLSGVNAIAMDGKLVSTDATGNRVAPTIFGPKQVILVAGVNKIVKNLDEALRRIKEVVAPINAKRHLTKHKDQRFDLPCVKKGTCVDCSSPDRQCCYTIIIEAERQPNTLIGYVPRIHVIIVGEELGI